MGNNRIASLIHKLSLEGVEESLVHTDRRSTHFSTWFLVTMCHNDSCKLIVYNISFLLIAKTQLNTTRGDTNNRHSILLQESTIGYFCSLLERQKSVALQ